jgi:hypothetical protein
MRSLTSLIEAIFGMIETQAIAIDFNLQKEVVNLRSLMNRYNPFRYFC